MPACQKILFQEISSTATDFLHELNDPNLLRNRAIPRIATLELKRSQVVKLRENISILSAKREDFNRKMEEYIRNLEALIRSLEKAIAVEADEAGAAAPGASRPSTKVRCLACEAEMIFRDLQIIFARESDESMALPTDVYVLAGGRLKKGHFVCGYCGTASLVIRAC
jgi:hypothetical protein